MVGLSISRTSFEVDRDQIMEALMAREIGEGVIISEYSGKPHFLDCSTAFRRHPTVSRLAWTSRLLSSPILDEKSWK